jgi:polar amino acid transport system substrate-binding protein
MQQCRASIQVREYGRNGVATKLSLVVLVLALYFPYAAHAVCSRPVVVPTSPLGKLAFVAEGGNVAGVYPEVLREYGTRAGCEFVFPVVPRKRAEQMVQAGYGDIFIGSAQAPDRDAWGEFIPLLMVQWTLISNHAEPAPKSVRELLSLPDVRVNVVRSYNAGPIYLALLAELDKRGALEYVSDPQTIVRKMLIGRTDYTIMPSGTFAGTIDDLGLRHAFERTVRYTRLEGLPASVTGAYISKAMPRSDAKQVERIFQQIRQERILLLRLRSLYTPEEMISYSELPRQR